MSLPQAFLEELRLRLPLAGLVGRRVRLIKRGREFTGLCPFHNEKSPSFTVSDDKGFYHCFGCGAHGDAISFVMNTEGLGFMEAVEKLAGEAGLEVPRQSPREREAEQQRASLHDVTEAACRFFQSELTGPGGQTARRYLEGRGLTQATIASFRLGFAPNRRGALRQALKDLGIEEEQLIEAGLLKRAEDGSLREYFFDRVIFPICDRRGRVIAFGGRTMGDAQPKYLNSPDTPLFHKGRTLYNLDRARLAAQSKNEIAVVEGYMDAIALAQAGFPGAVAPLGTAVTEEQLQELWRLTPEPIVCLDGDAAGQRAARRAAARALPLLKPGRSLRFAYLPSGDDPDSLVRAKGLTAFTDALARAEPLIEAVWQAALEGPEVTTPERKAALLANLQAEAGRIGDEGVKRLYLAELKDRFYQRFNNRAQQPGRFKARDSRFVPQEKGGQAARQGGDLTHRRDQALLALVINHPALLHDQVEELAALTLPGPGLERLRQALVDLAAEAPDLDSGAVCAHLSGLGLGELVASIRHASVYALTAAARPDAALADARRAFTGLVAEFAVSAALDAVKREEGRFAATPTEENLARVQAALRLLREAEARRGGDDV